MGQFEMWQMALTLEKEQRLDAVGLIEFFYGLGVTLTGGVSGATEMP